MPKPKLIYNESIAKALKISLIEAEAKGTDVDINKVIQESYKRGWSSEEIIGTFLYLENKGLVKTLKFGDQFWAWKIGSWDLGGLYF